MKNLVKTTLCAVGLCLSATTVSYGQTWSMKKAKLMTAFASTIDTANVRGEHPRPQMARSQWLNLNGIWQFQPANSLTETLPAGKLSSKILVPFPVESAISGVMTHYDKMWYRRTFNVPETWAGERVLLHFDAVDYQTEVFINNVSLGIHKGGYDPFTYDITSYLKAGQPQEVTVRVFDPTDNGGQPRGKQTLYPGGIMYTPSSGIWQPVWLEAVPQSYISDIRLIPNVDNSTLKFKAITTGAATNLSVTVDVMDGASKVTSFTGNVNTDLTISVPGAKLWTPDSPFLYDLKIKLNNGTTVVDSLSSYFGMRKISIGQVGNYKKMMLNNEFLFQFGPLDQGFWPDGLYTAPTDLAMKNDLTKTKQLGFNMIRKHIKVEPYRWYYWADKLGILVWQDMPSPNSYCNVHPAIDTVAYKSELETMVKTHWNCPCIISWVVFNEGQGQHNTESLVADVKSMDPYRLVNQASGGEHHNVGDILDWHAYPPPACPSSSTQIEVCGEFGGIGYTVSDHIWNNGSTYVMVNNTTDLFNMYSSFADMLVQFKTNGGMSAAVYTEITDVESELNGLLTYDRALLKGSYSKYFSTNQRVIKKNLYLTDVLPTSINTGRTWKYTTTQPDDTWYSTTFSDSNWKSGTGGFGTAGTPGGTIRTTWNSSDIWMRQTFTLGSLTNTMLDSLVLRLHHDEDCEVYINGILATSQSGYTSAYMVYPINDLARNALNVNGTNTIAIHCKQTAGGQYIDAGISLLSYEKQQVIAGVNTTKVNPGLKVYPNPAHNTLSVVRNSPETELVGIYNVVGGEMMKLNKTASQVDISSLQSGVYFMKTKTNQQIETVKFVKN